MGIGKYDRLSQIRREAARTQTKHEPPTIPHGLMLPAEGALLTQGFKPIKVTWFGSTPPTSWIYMHDHALQNTATNGNRIDGIGKPSSRSLAKIRANMPVPRTASHHFTRLPLTSDPATFYFY